MARSNVPSVARAVAAQRYLSHPGLTDPLGPLVNAVQEALVQHVVLVRTSSGGTALQVENLQVTVSGVSATKHVQPLIELGDAVRHVVAEALAASLAAMTVEGTELRLTLARNLLTIEMGQVSSTGEVAVQQITHVDSDPLLKTADVATQLGMSRPYVSMLCDTGKLGAVVKTEGGHRRVRQSAIDAYKLAVTKAESDNQTPREAAKKAGMYEHDDAAFVSAAHRERTPAPNQRRPRATKK